MADSAVGKISETTGVDKSLIDDNLNKATDVAKEKIKEVVK